MQVAVRLLGLGWYVAVCIVLGVLGGVWLDDRFGVTPLFTLLGVGFGLIVAAWGGLPNGRAAAQCESHAKG